MKTHLLALALASVPYPSALSATVSAPSGEWTPLAGNYDFFDDLQPGHPDTNIVGSGTDYGLFVTHNENGPASDTDGTFGFRLRLDGPGGNKNDTKYTRAAYLGIDADFNDSLDVYVGLNFSGSRQELGLYAPGPGANNSPGSTSVESTPFKTYAVNPDNFNYRPVDNPRDGGTTNDLNPDSKGGTDYYLSVLVDFADIVSYLSEKGIIINDSSPLRFVAATSTQGNNLNEDIAGIRGDGNSTSTWTELGVFTDKVTASGTVIPEPQSGLLAIGGLALACLRRRREDH